MGNLLNVCLPKYPSHFLWNNLIILLNFDLLYHSSRGLYPRNCHDLLVNSNSKGTCVSEASKDIKARLSLAVQLFVPCQSPDSCVLHNWLDHYAWCNTGKKGARKEWKTCQEKNKNWPNHDAFGGHKYMPAVFLCNAIRLREAIWSRFARLHVPWPQCGSERHLIKTFVVNWQLFDNKRVIKISIYYRTLFLGQKRRPNWQNT